MSTHKYDMTNSHLLVHTFDYLEPASLAEAISMIKDYGDQARLLAGGTNLLVDIKMERAAPRALINIAKLPELKGIEQSENGVKIGALATIRKLMHYPPIGAQYQALQDACAAFGSTQVQIMGTIGGNLCNGSPASDTVPALLAFDAQLTVNGPQGERTLTVEELLVGPGKTSLQSGEVLTTVLLPAVKPNTGSAFLKLSRVRADLAKISIAALVVRDGDRIVDCRLAFGSAGPTVLRAREAEKVLIGKPFTQELALEAGRVASGEISPIDDVRSTAWYRREAAVALTHDALQTAWERAASPASPGPAEHTSLEAPPPTSFRVRADETKTIELVVNGDRQLVEVAPNELLLNLLRDRLQLTGPKYGCGIGECGACTVWVNGEPNLGCLVLAISLDQAQVQTVEGLAGKDGTLDAIQQAFIDNNAFQCGFCTPGMLMMTRKLLAEIPAPSEEEIRDYLKGNYCRCTGYASIVRAVNSVTKETHPGGTN